MINTLYACLINRKISGKKVVEELRVKKAVYIDELTREKSPPPPSKGVKKSVRFADSEPNVVGEDSEKNLVKGGCGGKEIGERGRGIRVNVKMTKEEAARLLSKCKEGGVLEFKDVARELVVLPVNRVSVVSIITNDR